MTQKNLHLFEVSWEVCNKVGGIYEVVASKARLADQAFKGGCILLGPDTRHNAEFTETDEPFWDAIRYPLKEKGLRCRFGRWEIPGRPRVVLVDFRGRHDSNQLLHQLWERFGVDSLSGGWDYIEPVLFSYTCGEEKLNKDMISIETVVDKYDVMELKDMITEHVAYTNSGLGKEILNNFEAYLPKFKKIIPNDYKRMISTIGQMEVKGLSSEQAMIEAFYAIKNQKVQ